MHCRGTKTIYIQRVFKKTYFDSGRMRGMNQFSPCFMIIMIIYNSGIIKWRFTVNTTLTSIRASLSAPWEKLSSIVRPWNAIILPKVMPIIHFSNSIPSGWSVLGFWTLWHETSPFARCTAIVWGLVQVCLGLVTGLGVAEQALLCKRFVENKTKLMYWLFLTILIIPYLTISITIISTLFALFSSPCLLFWIWC